MYLSWEDRGNLAAVIANWPQPNVEITCITDGSRILGLGDLGINGIGLVYGVCWDKTRGYSSSDPGSGDKQQGLPGRPTVHGKSS